MLREALLLFGFKRLTQGIEARMDHALEFALGATLLERRDGTYFVGK